MRKHHFFGAGPSQVPLPVIERVREHLLEYESSGRSILEIGHRNPLFISMLEQAETGILDLLDIPRETHRALFFAGGARQQFQLIPFNFMSPSAPAEYLMTDYWSEQAASAAAGFGEIRRIVCDIARDQSEPCFPDATAPVSYRHVTSNGTVNGYQLVFPIASPGCPLIADMSSDLLTRSLPDLSPDVIYAGAQKNLGCAGLSVVIGRQSVLERTSSRVPPPWSYAILCDLREPNVTPPVLSIAVAAEMIRWTRGEGGVAEMERRSRIKAHCLYSAIDANADVYCNSVAANNRSRQNVVWHMRGPEMEASFIEAAVREGLTGIRGHASAGGVRVSLYNGVSIAEAEDIARFMDVYARRVR